MVRGDRTLPKSRHLRARGAGQRPSNGPDSGHEAGVTGRRQFHGLSRAFAALLLALALTAAGTAARAQAGGAAGPAREAALAEAKALGEQAARLYKAGAYAEATTPAQRAVALREKALGKEHPDVATALNALADLYREQGAYVQAEALFLRALAIREKALGKEHPDLATTLNNLGELYRAQGAYHRSEPLVLRALAIREKMLGKEHPDVAVTLNNLGGLYWAQGAYDRSESLFLRALAIREKVLGSEHTDVAQSLSNLAVLYKTQSAYEKVEPLVLRALAIQEKALGKEHPDVAATLNNLAEFYRQRGAYPRAEPLYLRALAIQEKALGSEHPDVAITLNNLALLYEGQGAHARAEALYLRVISIQERTLGKEHPDVATALNNLAVLYREQSSYARAEALLLRALAIEEKALGKEHPDVATALNSLAVLYQEQSSYARAEALFLRALAIREKAFGKEHPGVAPTLNDLALLYREQGAYDKAEPLLLRALAMKEKALGKEHPGVATTLNNLALLYRSQGAYVRAEALYLRVLAIEEKALGNDHPVVASTLNNLAWLYAAKNDVASASRQFARMAAIRETSFGTELGALSESRKRESLSHFRIQAEALLSFFAQNAPGDIDMLRLALTTTWLQKGRVLDELIGSNEALRRNLTPALRDEFDALNERRVELATRRNASYDPRQAEALRALASEVERREAELATKSAPLRSQVEPLTVERVQAALPEGAALVEFVRYHRVDFRVGTESWREERYVAYVLRREGPPLFADLGEAAPIEAAALAARRALADPLLDAREPLRALDTLVLAPVRRVAGEPAHLLLSPDGPLHLVPFEAFVDEHGRYLLERSTVTYLTSARDLLRLSDRPPARSAPLVVAAPDFGPGDWPPLPGTAAEAEALRKHFPAATVVTGEAATKEAFIRTQGPRFVHVATHGLFARRDVHAPSPDVVMPPDPRGLMIKKLAPPPADSFAPEDALDDSALLFAGANTRPEARVTAREAAGLDLGGTELVVLSACETGLGELGSSEGVYGLRRALSVAGAASQVVSLWKVSDNATGTLMGAYYGELKAGAGRSEALRRAQLGLLRQDKFKHPFYWAAFVPAGDWRPLGGEVAVPAQPRPAACETRAAGANTPGSLLLMPWVLAGFALNARRVRRTPRRVRTSIQTS
jgi:CHAT domain-containing protein/Tfp pilus assembly protein PilF